MTVRTRQRLLVGYPADTRITIATVDDMEARRHGDSVYRPLTQGTRALPTDIDTGSANPAEANTDISSSAWHPISVKCREDDSSPF